jgi:hypothetical protein
MSAVCVAHRMTFVAKRGCRCRFKIERSITVGANIARELPLAPPRRERLVSGRQFCKSTGCCGSKVAGRSSRTLLPKGGHRRLRSRPVSQTSCPPGGSLANPLPQASSFQTLLERNRSAGAAVFRRRRAPLSARLAEVRRSADAGQAACIAASRVARPAANRPYFDEIRSTSNTSVAFGGITPPAPRAP